MSYSRNGLWDTKFYNSQQFWHFQGFVMEVLKVIYGTEEKAVSVRISDTDILVKSLCGSCGTPLSLPHNMVLMAECHNSHKHSQSFYY